MLINFSVTNFRSFHGSQSCSFLASSDDSHASTHCVDTGIRGVPRLLKSAVIFGANSSGKSNLLLALRTMREMVVNSTSFSESEFAARYVPFRLDSAEGKPTVFDIEVLIEGVRYRYSFAFDAGRIVCEQLLVYNKRKSQRWFERHVDPDTRAETWMPFSANLIGPREMWRKATRPNALFLTTAGRLNSQQFQPLLQWFEHHLEIILSSDVGDVAAFAHRLRNPRFKSRLLQVLRALDLHVDDLRVTESPHAQGRLGRPKIELLHPGHGPSPMWLELTHESAGLQRVVAMLGPLLEAMERGKLAAIDEFDANLHPLVARFLIQLVNDPGVSACNAQLLLSSHNTALMDLNLLRRDEIWLMGLDHLQASNLSAMGQHNARKHELVAKGYLRGRFGAIPDIDPQREFEVSNHEGIDPE